MSSTYLQSEEELFEKLNSSEQGLDNQQVASIREVEGPNVLERAKKKTKLAIYVPVFGDILKVSALDWRSMSMIILVTAGGVIAIELVKLMTRKKTENRPS